MYVSYLVFKEFELSCDYCKASELLKKELEYGTLKCEEYGTLKCDFVTEIFCQLKWCNLLEI